MLLTIVMYYLALVNMLVNALIISSRLLLKVDKLLRINKRLIL